MGTVVIIVIALVIIFVFEPFKSKEQKQKELEEEKRKERVKNLRLSYKYNMLENETYLKYFGPLQYDMLALKDYYKRGGKKLTESETKMYFSYPKLLVADNDDNLKINGISMGKAKDHILLKEWDTIPGENKPKLLTMGRYQFFKNDCNRKLTLENPDRRTYYHLDEGDKNWNVDKELRRKDKLKNIKKHLLKDFNKCKKLLPKEYLELANDLMTNNYVISEMDQKYSNLYKKMQDEYYETIDKKIKDEIKDIKEKVEHVSAGYGFVGAKIPIKCVQKFTEEESEYISELGSIDFINKKLYNEKMKPAEDKIYSKYPEIYEKIKNGDYRNI